MKKGSLDNKAAHNSLIILMPGHILLVEAVYCKDNRPTILKDPNFENIYKINNIKQIDQAPNDWHLCEKEEYIKFSPWSTIKHYFLVLKNGFIPSEYIKLEIDNSSTRED